MTWPEKTGPSAGNRKRERGQRPKRRAAPADHGDDGGADDDVAFPVFTPTSRPRCLDDEYDALTYYAYDANGGAGAGGGGVVVAVVGAAHFDGVVARWNDAARVRTQE